jgi:hypothetical protein
VQAWSTRSVAVERLSSTVIRDDDDVRPLR